MRLFVFFADRLLRWAGPIEGDFTPGTATGPDSAEPQAGPITSNDGVDEAEPPEHWKKLVASEPPQHWLDLFHVKSPTPIEGHDASNSIAEVLNDRGDFYRDRDRDRNRARISDADYLAREAAPVSDSPPPANEERRVLKRRREDSGDVSYPKPKTSWLNQLKFPAESSRSADTPANFIRNEVRRDSTFRTEPEDTKTDVGGDRPERLAEKLTPRWGQTPTRATRTDAQNFQPNRRSAPRTTNAPEAANLTGDKPRAGEPLEINYVESASPRPTGRLTFIDRLRRRSNDEQLQRAPVVHASRVSTSEASETEATIPLEKPRRSENISPAAVFNERRKSTISFPMKEQSRNTRSASTNEQGNTVYFARPPAKRSEGFLESQTLPFTPARGRKPTATFPKNARRGRDKPSMDQAAETAVEANDDRWPALPLAPVFEKVDELFARESEVEGLRRLEREQRGILWNE